jgi:hypothetical protein
MATRCRGADGAKTSRYFTVTKVYGTTTFICISINIYFTFLTTIMGVEVSSLHYPVQNESKHIEPNNTQYNTQQLPKEKSCDPIVESMQSKSKRKPLAPIIADDKFTKSDSPSWKAKKTTRCQRTRASSIEDGQVIKINIVNADMANKENGQFFHGEGSSVVTSYEQHWWGPVQKQSVVKSTYL